MDSGLTMVFHCMVITVLLYLLLVYVLKQPVAVAADRSILIGAFVLIYMVLYGHTFPPKLSNLNPNIFKK